MTKSTQSMHIPPLKIQGIKTKLIPVIKENIDINDKTVWIEPFMGSGVVGFNIAPQNAIFSDTNPYIIQFYNDIKNNIITSSMVREFLEKEGKQLEEKDDTYYYEVRERFNKHHNSLDFLFLNRACFNGMIRFNREGNFNVPYCHKPYRFSKAYITKIVNQIKYIEEQLKTKNWVFLCQSFEKTIEMGQEYKDVFIYCDPPYIGRNTNYYDNWDEEKELSLKQVLVASNKKFMVSTWDYNQYRCNEYINTVWSFCNKVNTEHFYHVGAKEKNRSSMIEALLMNYKKV
jgi:DNA adenine methylase